MSEQSEEMRPAVKDYSFNFNAPDAAHTAMHLHRLADAAKRGTAELAALAKFFRKFGPTRAMKKSWRRRLSRARWSQNDTRFVMGRQRHISVGSFRLDEERSRIVARWLRDDHDDADVDGCAARTDDRRGLSPDDVEAAVRILGAPP